MEEQKKSQRFMMLDPSYNKRMFGDNRLKTTHYKNIPYFIVFAVLNQFKRFANIYFLFIVTLQCIPQVSPLNPVTAVLPFLFVLGISITREAIEDCMRWRVDKANNSRPYDVYRNVNNILQMTRVRSSDLLVGDVLLLRNESEIPTDMVLIRSSNSTNTCYIETSSLDGERNLKRREAPAGFKGFQYNYDENILKGVISYGLDTQKPNSRLHSFQGRFLLGNVSIPLDENNLLLQGASLVNTDWVLGVVVFTGQNTKLMQNSKRGSMKQSRIEKKVNRIVISIFISQAIVCFIIAILAGSWHAKNDDEHYYLQIHGYSAGAQGLKAYFSYFLLMNTFIPISLVVSIEVIKIIQGYFFARDAGMASKYRQRFMKVNTVSINEELGQVHYIFSDKTGTLTMNEMIFKSFIAGNQEVSDDTKGLIVTSGEFGELQGFRSRSNTISDSRTLKKIRTQRPELQLVDYYPLKKNQTNIEEREEDYTSDMNETMNNPQRKQTRVMITNTLLNPIVNKQMMADSSHQNLMESKMEDIEEDKESEEESDDSQSLISSARSVASDPDEYKKKAKKINEFQVVSVNVLPRNPLKRRGTEGGSTDMSQPQRVVEFFQIMTVCHDCVPEKVQINGEQKIFYQSQSPDEQAFVEYANTRGFRFEESGNNYVKVRIHEEYRKYLIHDPRKKDNISQVKKFKLLYKMPFNSTRKRMSVIIQDPDDKKYKLYCKGADNVINARIDPLRSHQGCPKPLAKAFLDKGSKKGYRTLLFAMKELTQHQYTIWRNKMRKEEANIDDTLEDRKQKLYEEIEKDMIRIGATSIEDRLQQNVAETISSLREAGIHVWMLTGDKLETAENIAHSCALFSSQTNYLRVPTKEQAKTLFQGQRVQHEKWISSTDRGLIIEHDAIEWLFLKENQRYCDNFILNAKTCKSVVCCRVTPAQKAEVVKRMRASDKKMTTLSVGDGANDVPMIQQANIGIGVYGNEGMNAVAAADYAIGDFKALSRLVLFHGRLSYLRIAELILYFFYKNVVFTLAQFFFAFSNGFSGTSFYDDWYITFFNILFTSLPLVVKAVLELDIPEKSSRAGKVADQHQQASILANRLYYIGQNELIFNFPAYFYWLATGILHGIIAYFITKGAAFAGAGIREDGVNADMWFFSVTIYTCVIVIVTWKIFVFQRHFTWICLFGYLFSIITYILWLMVADNLSSAKTYRSLRVTTLSWRFWFIVLLSSSFCLLLDYFIVQVLRFGRLNPTLYLMRFRDSIKERREEFLREVRDHIRFLKFNPCRRVKEECKRLWYNCKRRQRGLHQRDIRL